VRAEHPDKDELERQRAEFEHVAIGPTGSAASSELGRNFVDIYFKVRWDDRLEALYRYGAEQGAGYEMDSATRWTGFLQDGRVTCCCEVNWPTQHTMVVLYFDVDKWRVELELLQTADRFILCPSGPLEPAGPAVMVANASSDLVAAVLKATRA
jgi:hypothetical protein